MDVRHGIIKEIFAPARRNFPKPKIVVVEPWETISADLVDMKQDVKYNKNHRYILTLLDHFTKYAFAVGTKTKKADEIARKLEIILNQVEKLRGKYPLKFLLTDRGKEFKNSQVSSVLEKNNLTIYHTHSLIKASIVER